MKNTCIMLLALAIALCGTVQAQNLSKVGTTAAQLLKVDVGPRGVGMGGAFVATADDISAIYWNPAGIAANQSAEAYFNHVEWLAEVNYDYAAFASFIPGMGTLGAFVSVLSMDEMMVRTVEQPEGTGEWFSAGALSAGVSFARDLTDNFSIGFNAKYVREHIYNCSASGFAVDIGTLYKINVLNELRIASSISNFGTKMQLDGRDILQIEQLNGSSGNMISTKIDLNTYDMPLMFRVGVAVDAIKSESMRLTTEVDAVHPNDHTEYLNLGMEYSWNEILNLRFGRKALMEDGTEQGLCYGAGINYSIPGSIRFRLDYAYQDVGRLGNVQYLSLAVKF